VKAKIFFVAIMVISWTSAHAQSRDASPSPVTDKALISNTGGAEMMAAAALHTFAKDYYNWRNENYPVRSSDAGLHTWDNKLTDYSPGKIAARAQHVHGLLEKVRAMQTGSWPKDERIDAILFRAQLERVDFEDRVLKFERTNPQVYVAEWPEQFAKPYKALRAARDAIRALD